LPTAQPDARVKRRLTRQPDLLRQRLATGKPLKRYRFNFYRPKSDPGHSILGPGQNLEHKSDYFTNQLPNDLVYAGRHKTPKPIFGYVAVAGDVNNRRHGVGLYAAWTDVGSSRSTLVTTLSSISDTNAALKRGALTWWAGFPSPGAPVMHRHPEDMRRRMHDAISARHVHGGAE